MRSFSKAIYPKLNRFLEVSPVCIQIFEGTLNSDIEKLLCGYFQKAVSTLESSESPSKI
jgi:hypothetical protein